MSPALTHLRAALVRDLRDLGDRYTRLANDIERSNAKPGQWIGAALTDALTDALNVNRDAIVLTTRMEIAESAP